MEKWKSIESRLEELSWYRCQDLAQDDLFKIPAYKPHMIENKQHDTQMTHLYKWFILLASNNTIEITDDDSITWKKLQAIQQRIDGRALIKSKWIPIVASESVQLKKDNGKIIISFKQYNWSIAIIRVPMEVFQ